MSEPRAPAKETDSRPERAGLVLASLIAVATVANLNLSVANVAIPEIGNDFDSSQTMLNLIAVGYRSASPRRFSGSGRSAIAMAASCSSSSG